MLFDFLIDFPYLGYDDLLLISRMAFATFSQVVGRTIDTVHSKVVIFSFIAGGWPTCLVS